jgi:hypothetical protein
VIVYQCDRCEVQTAPQHLADVKIVFTPRARDGGEDCDFEDRRVLGHVCDDCRDAVTAAASRLMGGKVRVDLGRC